MVLEDSLVSVHLDSLVHDVKIKILVVVNHVRIMVFALIQVLVDIHVNVLRALKDQLVNKVYH
jgi:hypothetical protein